jgi:hypothetical protein
MVSAQASIKQPGRQSAQPDIMGFLDAFPREDVQLERPHMVLLPKKPGANEVSAFRPICLQNCCVKILSKILTTRLQTQTQQPSGSRLDRFHFIKGLSITENFVYAMELIQCCHRRKTPTLVVKLAGIQLGCCFLISARDASDVRCGHAMEVPEMML